ncbi:hypothetical protein FQZ97_673660 [compost metagenome]
MGPLWFAWALILLTLVWVVWTGTMSRAAPRSASPQAPVPRGRAWLLSAALLVGVAALTIRQWFPVGQNVLGLQLGYFAPYVFLFLLGARASVSRWLLFSSRLRKCPRNHAEQSRMLLRNGSSDLGREGPQSLALQPLGPKARPRKGRLWELFCNPLRATVHCSKRPSTQSSCKTFVQNKRHPGRPAQTGAPSRHLCGLLSGRDPSFSRENILFNPC